MNNVKVNDLYRSKINVIFLVVEDASDTDVGKLIFLGPGGLFTLYLSELEWMVKRKVWFKIDVE